MNATRRGRTLPQIPKTQTENNFHLEMLNGLYCNQSHNCLTQRKKWTRIQHVFVFAFLIFDNLMWANILMFSSWKMGEGWWTDTTQYAAAAGVQLLYGAPPVAAAHFWRASNNIPKYTNYVKAFNKCQTNILWSLLFYHTTLVYFTYFKCVTIYLYLRYVLILIEYWLTVRKMYTMTVNYSKTHAV